MEIVVKKIKPMFNGIVTTMEQYKEKVTNGLVGIDTPKTGLSQYQKVVAVGSTVRDIKVGDLVSINPKRYAKMRHKEGGFNDGVMKDNSVVTYEFDTIELDGETYLRLFDNDIEYIVEEFTEVEDSTQLITESDIRKPIIL